MALQSPSQADEGQEPKKQEDELLSVRFNQDYSCLACGTDTGFRIYNLDPFKKTIRREFNNGGIGTVEMLFRCNILALVGGGRNPRYPPNKVMIWDDHQSRCIGELSFRSEVRAVKLRRDRIVVVLEHKTYVYNFADLKLLHQIETLANPRGLCALTPDNSAVLACPGLHKGQVRIELYDQKKTRFIAAHDSELACFTLSCDGTKLATASTKGTLVRVFSTTDGSKLQELRRGLDRAEVYSLAFSRDNRWLALSSDKATVHVYAVQHGSPNEDINGVVAPATPNPSTATSPSQNGTSLKSTGAPHNTASSFSFMRGVLPKYFSSEWSFAQYRLPEEMRCIVGFGPEKYTLVVVGADGSFHKIDFDPQTGGECRQLEYKKFMKPDEDTAETD